MLRVELPEDRSRELMQTIDRIAAQKGGMQNAE